MKSNMSCRLVAVLFFFFISSVHAALNSTGGNSTNSSLPVVTIPGNQSKPKDAGLPGVLYAGVAIAVVAIVGFFVECCLHKRTYWAKRNEINAGLQTSLPNNRIV